MKIDISTQIAIAQCWLVSQILCYPLFNNKRSDIQKGTRLFPRALSSSFMPGFGKRQSVRLQNEDRNRAMHQSAFDKYGSELEGRIRDRLYNTLLDSSNSNYKADLTDDIVDDESEFVLDKDTLQALIDDYFGRTVQEVKAMDTDLPGNWNKHDNRDRLLDSILKLRTTKRRNYVNGNDNNNNPSWRDNSLQSEDLKI